MTITLNGTTGITTPAETVTGTDVWSVGSTQIYKDTSGNVGIGTSSPSTLLQLGGATNKSMRIDSATGNAGYIGTYQTYTIVSANRNPSTGVFADTSKAASYISLDANISNGQISFGTTASNNTEPTERMRIDSSGNLLVGTTTVDQGSKLTVSGSNAISAICTGNQGSAYYGTYTGTGTGYFGYWKYGSTIVGSISSTGTTTAYNTSSDYRLKENIAPMTGALAKVSELKPVTYTWKSTGEESQGFIAHELQAVVPDCVTGEKDAVDAEGNPVYQGIDTSFLVATLTAAIQELKAELDTVKTELATLKGTA